MTGPPDPGYAAVLEELRAALAPAIQVVERLGQGGMGIVFLGRDTTLKRLVAIKVLDPVTAAEESARQRFAREAEAAAALDHGNVINIFQVGTLPASGVPYFIMQFVEGRTLGEAFPPGQPAPNGVARRIVGEVASALGAAHAKGLVHRDVKPSNIIIEAGTGRAVVVDFGISAILEKRALLDPTTSPKLTATGMYIGTPSHMSPEQAAGDPISDRSDVYSLGVVAYELLAGHPPFTGRTAMELIAAHLKDQPQSILESRPDADPELAQLIDGCLAKDPEKRPRAVEIARFLLPTHQALEWPPPGLGDLHGRGARLTTALGAAAMVLWTLFGTLLLQSTRMTACCWGEFEGNSVFGGVRSLLRTSIPLRVTELSLGPLFGIVIVVTVLALPILVAITGRRAWDLASAWRRGRSVGYPMRLLASVAWDRHRDTASLFNGVELFAVASDADRAKFMRMRRWEAALLAAAAVAALLLPVVWALGLDPDVTHALLSQREVFIMIVPFLALLIGAAAVAHPEQAFRQKSRARAGRRPPGMAIRTDVMHDWMKRAGETPARSRRGIHPAVVAALIALLVVPMGFVIALGAGTLLFVGARIDQARDATISYRKKGLPDPWGRIRRAHGPVYQLEQWNDERAGLVPAALVRRDTLQMTGIVYDTALLRKYQGEERMSSALTNSVLIHMYRTPALFPDTVVARLAKDTLSEVLTYWRAFAHAPQPAQLWYYRMPRDVRTDHWAEFGPPGYLPAINFYMRRTLDRNRAAALLAFRRGDKAEALLRLRENITGLRYMNASGLERFRITEDPGYMEYFAKITGDSALAREARAVATPDWVPWGRDYTTEPPARFADPTRPTDLGFIADTSRSKMIRLFAISDILGGFCFNAREIMFGVSPLRLAILDSAEHLMKDIERPELMTRATRLLVQMWIDDPVGAGKYEQARDPGLFGVLRVIGPRGVAARLGYCRATMNTDEYADLRGILTPGREP